MNRHANITLLDNCLYIFTKHFYTDRLTDAESFLTISYNQEDEMSKWAVNTVSQMLFLKIIMKTRNTHFSDTNQLAIFTLTYGAKSWKKSIKKCA